MMSFVNAIPTGLFVVLSFVLSIICFSAAIQYKKKGDKTDFILFLVVSLSSVPTIILRVVDWQGHDPALQRAAAVCLILYLLILLIAVYYRGWKKYREKSLSPAEMRRIKIGLILLPIVVLIAVLCFVFWD